MERGRWAGRHWFVSASYAGAVAVCAAVACSARGQPSAGVQAIPPDGVLPASAAHVAEEPETVVLLKDGRRITGLLIERTADGVVLRVAGIRTPLSADLVDRVEVLPPVLERYRAMRAAIDPNDPDQLVQLADWLRSREKYDEAIVELTLALAARPNHSDATRLLTLVRGQRELAERARRARPSAVQGPGGPPAASPVRPPFPVLSAEQINIIKVYETDLNDPPDLVIPRETMTKLMERHAGDPAIPPTAEGREAIYRWPPSRQLALLFKLQARELYPEVRVVGQPRAMVQFRDNLHRPWIVNSCATSRCHGGEEAGRLYLSNHRPNGEETVYTNFLILERFRLADGSPLIDYDEPAKSPLLHMALPRRDSLFPHPTVPGPGGGRSDQWRPSIKSADDRRFVLAVEWIQSMYAPRPEYPVQYQPPRPLWPEAALPAGPTGK